MGTPVGNGIDPVLFQQQMQLMMQMQQQMADMQKQLNEQNAAIRQQEQKIDKLGPGAQQKTTLLIAQLDALKQDEKAMRERIDQLQASLAEAVAGVSSCQLKPGHAAVDPKKQTQWNSFHAQEKSARGQLATAQKALAEIAKKRSAVETEMLAASK